MTGHVHGNGWLRRGGRLWLGLGLLLAGLAGAGCSLTDTIGPAASSSSQPVSGEAAAPRDPFAPEPPPSGFDPVRAEAALKDIPGDPPAPAAARPGTTAPELPRQAMRRMTEARRLFGEQRYSETVTEAEKTIRYNTNNAEAYRLAALASLFAGKDKPARTYAEAALALRPDDAACHYVRGRLAQKGEQPDLAMAEYRTALKCPADSQNADYVTLTRYHLGLLLHELGYYRACTEQLLAYEKAVAGFAGKEPENPELAGLIKVKRLPALLALADAQEAVRQFGPAADTLGAALRLQPSDGELAVRLVKNLVRARRFADAAARAQELASAGKPDLKQVELILAVHRAAGTPQRGLAALQQIVARNPDQVELALAYGDALIAARQYSRAIDVLNDVVSRHPDASAARWKLVSVHRDQGNHRAWMWALAGQLAANPSEMSRATRELARMRVDEAGWAIDEALGRKPAPASQPGEASTGRVAAAHAVCLAWLADRLNRLADAEALYARAAQVDPGFAPAVLGKANLWVTRCEWDKALEVLATARPDANAAEVERLKARCHDGLDQVDQAAKHYEESIRLEPDPETMLQYGRMLDRSHRPKEAAAVYERLIAAKPDLALPRELLISNLLNRWSEGDNLKQLLSAIKDMQQKTPGQPATVRATALVGLLMRQPVDMANYARTMKALVDSHPDDLQSRRALSMAWYRMGEYGRADQELREVLRKEPRDSEANEMLAIVLMRDLRIEEAAEHLVHALQWYPNREGLLRNLGETRLVQQNYPAAQGTWQTLVSLPSSRERRPVYRSRLVETCLQAGWYDKARSVAEAWLKDADEKQVPVVRSYLLAADAREGKYDQYLERCRQWLKEEPKDELARRWLLGIGDLPGQARGGLIGAERLAEAVTQATAWASEAANDPQAQSDLVDTLRAAHRPADIIEICRADLSLADKPQERLAPLQTLAGAYLAARRYDDAIATARELTAQAAQATEADLGFELDELMVTFLAQAKRYDDAVSQSNRLIADLDQREARLQELAGKEGNSNADMGRRVAIMKEQEKTRRQRASVLRSLSFVHTRQERRDAAIDCLRQALKLNPNEPGLNNDLGYTLADAGMEMNEAERMLKAAVSEVLWNGVGSDDRQAAFMDSLGWLYYKRGKFADALRWLSLAAKMEDGEDPVIYDHLGDVQWRLGRQADASRSWTRCLALQERKVREDSTDRDERLVAAVKAKVAEAGRQGKPGVATSLAD